jgi:xylose isomerase
MSEFIPEIKKIEYDGPSSRNPLAFKHYNPEEIVAGKTMKDHLRFSMAYWHSMRGVGGDPFGPGTINRPWEGNDDVENAKNRMRVAFEIMQKMNMPFYCFHDRDIAPEGSSLSESHKNLDAVVATVKELQSETGIQLLWGTANLFSNPRFMVGASTNPCAHVFAYAAAQVKKAMEVTKELGGVNYVFWGGREGYQTLLNTDIKRELDHMANFLRMAADYKKEIEFEGTLLIEPKPKEPTKHQYDFDAATVMGFLTHYGLNQEFKLNIEANHATLAGHDFEHELELASRYGMLGSVDANIGDLLLGWDTDQFSLDTKSTALAMLIILNQGGLGTGGLNFDAKLRRESTDIEDLFIAHIGSMDAYAKGLKIAAKIIEEGELSKWVTSRYSTYDEGIGAKIEAGTTDFKELSEWVLKEGEPQLRSGKQEKYESLLMSYLDE